MSLSEGTPVLALCVYRNISIPTFISSLQLISRSPGWDIMLETGDALISRARSICATRWMLQYTASDVLVMTDDDFSFTIDGIHSLVALAREKKAIVAGVTPLRSGRRTAIVPLVRGNKEPWRNDKLEPQEIRWAGGLIAYHRSVLESLSRTLPLLHENDVIEAFYPFFAPLIVESDGQKDYLSEDYACHERARQAGFSVWVQPKCQVQHLSHLLVSNKNMDSIYDLIKSG